MTISVLTENDFTPQSFAEAERRFAKKAALTSDAFEKLSAANQARAFRIAGVNKAKLVQRARDIVKQAIDQGTDYADVRRQLLAIFDTDGLPRPALHRLRTLFQQNVLGAYSQARTEVLKDPGIIEARPTGNT